MATAAAIIFDLDGVLVDTEELHREAFNRALAPYGHRYDRHSYGKLVGLGDRACGEALTARWPDIPVAGIDIVREKEIQYGELIHEAGRVTAMAGALEALTRLRDAFPLAVASATLRRYVMVTLDNARLRPFFSTVIAGDDVARNKPHPDIYLKAARRLNAPPHRCCAVEDSQNGLAAAVAAGMATIAIPNGYTAHHDLSRASLRLPSLEDLRAETVEAAMATPIRTP